MEGVEGEVVVVVLRGLSLFRLRSSIVLCTGTRESPGAGMSDLQRCMCPLECEGCYLYAAYGAGCQQTRRKADAGLPRMDQRCFLCAPIRDEELVRRRKAGKGKGSGSSGEASVAHLQYLVTILRKEVEDLRARVTDLEGAMQQS